MRILGKPVVERCGLSVSIGVVVRVVCSVVTEDGFTRFAENPSQLPLHEDFVVEGSFRQEVSKADGL